MTIKYRRLSPTGDYSFGYGNSDFLYDLEAVAQAVKTRLDLFLGSFWRDLTDGLPMPQQIWGSSGSEAHLAVVGNIIKDRIAGTKDVSEVLAYTYSYNRETRVYSFQARIQTIYSDTPVEYAAELPEPVVT